MPPGLGVQGDALGEPMGRSSQMRSQLSSAFALICGKIKPPRWRSGGVTGRMLGWFRRPGARSPEPRRAGRRTLCASCRTLRLYRGLLDVSSRSLVRKAPQHAGRAPALAKVSPLCPQLARVECKTTCKTSANALIMENHELARHHPRPDRLRHDPKRDRRSVRDRAKPCVRPAPWRTEESELAPGAKAS